MFLRAFLSMSVYFETKHLLIAPQDGDTELQEHVTTPKLSAAHHLCPPSPSLLLLGQVAGEAPKASLDSKHLVAKSAISLYMCGHVLHMGFIQCLSVHIYPVLPGGSKHLSTAGIPSLLAHGCSGCDHQHNCCSPGVKSECQPVAGSICSNHCGIANLNGSCVT